MARIVKSNFPPSAPCNLLILLDKKRVCSNNSSLIIKGLRPTPSLVYPRVLVITLP